MCHFQLLNRFGIVADSRIHVAAVISTPDTFRTSPGRGSGNIRDESCRRRRIVCNVHNFVGWSSVFAFSLFPKCHISQLVSLSTLSMRATIGNEFFI